METVIDLMPAITGQQIADLLREVAASLEDTTFIVEKDGKDVITKLGLKEGTQFYKVTVNEDPVFRAGELYTGVMISRQNKQLTVSVDDIDSQERLIEAFLDAYYRLVRK